MAARTIKKHTRPAGDDPQHEAQPDGGTPARFTKGGPAGPGRPKGKKDTVKQSVVVMVQTALELAHEDGGVGYLVEQSRENPKAFLSLVSKLIPRQVDATLRLDAGPELVKIMQQRRDRLAANRARVIDGTATAAE